MKKLVMTVEMKEADVMDSQEAVKIAEAYARTVDMMFCMRLQMYAAPMSFDEYVDRIEEIGRYTETGNFVLAINGMCRLAEKLDEDVRTVMKAYIIPNDNMTVAFLRYFHEELEKIYVEARFYEGQQETEPCEDFSELNGLTEILDKAYFLLSSLLNREVKTDEGSRCENYCDM